MNLQLIFLPIIVVGYNDMNQFLFMITTTWKGSTNGVWHFAPGARRLKSTTAGALFKQEHGGWRCIGRAGAQQPGTHWANRSMTSGNTLREWENRGGLAGLLPWLSATRWVSAGRWPEPRGCQWETRGVGRSACARGWRSPAVGGELRKDLGGAGRRGAGEEGHARSRRPAAGKVRCFCWGRRLERCAATAGGRPPARELRSRSGREMQSNWIDQGHFGSLPLVLVLLENCFRAL
jgi:hypothetical protein